MDGTGVQKTKLSTLIARRDIDDVGESIFSLNILKIFEVLLARHVDRGL